MEFDEAIQALTIYRQTQPNQKNFIQAHHQAKAALEAGLARVPAELMEAYFDKDLTTWPEVPPRLKGLHPDALAAFGRVAPRHPQSAYAAVLALYSQDHPDQIRLAYTWLSEAHSAMASTRGGSPQEQESIQQASADARLVAGLRSIWSRFENWPLRSRRPIGWAAILLHEGSEESVQLLEPFTQINWEEDPYDYDRQDLWWLRPKSPSEPAQAFLDKVERLLQERDSGTGQNEWFAALGLSNPPEVFQLGVLLPSRGGQQFCLQMSRSWRSSAVDWYVTVGKSRPIFRVRRGRQESNTKNLETLTLAGLPAWLGTCAASLKTRWKWDELQIREEGFSPPLEPALRNWLS